jgi:hypothetical protein
MTILLRVRHYQEAQRQAKIIADLARETSHQPNPPTLRPAGDERTLRGIPAIGRNVSGCIQGTNPEHAIRD